LGIQHRKHYVEDFKLLKSLNINAFRFSIEWGRVEPEEGKFSEEEIKFIKRYLLELKKHNITPVVSLWHWTMPTWFTNRGGFENKSNVKLFVRYCEYVLNALKDDIVYILTLNEPMIYTGISYLFGEWPPQKKSFTKCLGISRHLIYAHNQVYKTAKSINPSFQISIAHNTGTTELGDKKIKTKLARAFSVYRRDTHFLKSTYKYMDFLGINWYNHDTFINGKVKNPCAIMNDLGWDARPYDIHIIIEQLYKKYHLPILITENGLADAADTRRKWWIEETMKAIEVAQNNGVQMLGYLHWSAFDNFEWDKGFWPRFGLIAIEPKTLKRTIRPSAKWYAEQLKQRRDEPK
jgi:beta-glucosidase